MNEAQAANFEASTTLRSKLQSKTAQIVTILYGFMNKRSSDLEIGANSDGKARIEGLPDKLKKPPLKFKIRGGDLRKSVTQDPATDCHASFNAQLGRP
jgi:hypothetical protein